MISLSLSHKQYALVYCKIDIVPPATGGFSLSLSLNLWWACLNDNDDNDADDNVDDGSWWNSEEEREFFFWCIKFNLVHISYSSKILSSI